MTNYYFGSDTNAGETTCGTADQRFYIGRLGGELTAGGSGFNSTTAAAIDDGSRVYSYWDIAGPSASSADGRSASAWGTAQAQKYIDTWADNDVVDGSTLFADLEGGNGGWSASNKANNRKTLSAFLAKIALGATPGLYIRTNEYDSFLGSTWSPTTSFVYWLASTFSAITTCAKAESGWTSNIAPGGKDRGGMKVMIWQYHSNDYDITVYNGYQSGTWHPTKV